MKRKIQRAVVAAHIDGLSGVTRYANESRSHSQLKIHFSIQQQPARQSFLSHCDTSQLKIQLLIQRSPASITSAMAPSRALPGEYFLQSAEDQLKLTMLCD